jgi:hypothetical protein
MVGKGHGEGVVGEEGKPEDAGLVRAPLFGGGVAKNPYAHAPLPAPTRGKQGPGTPTHAAQRRPSPAQPVCRQGCAQRGVGEAGAGPARALALGRWPPPQSRRRRAEATTVPTPATRLARLAETMATHSAAALGA